MPDRAESNYDSDGFKGTFTRLFIFCFQSACATIIIKVIKDKG